MANKAYITSAGKTVNISNAYVCDNLKTVKARKAYRVEDGKTALLWNRLFPYIVGFYKGTEIYGSQDGINYESVGTLNFNPRCITFGNGKYVALGEAGQTAYSTDGASWITSSTGKSDIFDSVAYGNGRFVAIGYNGASYYSLDGITWTAMSGHGTYDYHFVDYFSSGVWMCCGDGMSCYSTDGTTWIQMRNISDDVTYYCIAYDGVYYYISTDSSEGIYCKKTPQELWGVSGYFNMMNSSTAAGVTYTPQAHMQIVGEYMYVIGEFTKTDTQTAYPYRFKYPYASGVTREKFALPKDSYFMHGPRKTYVDGEYIYVHYTTYGFYRLNTSTLTWELVMSNPTQNGMSAIAKGKI
jgi:hypothetical protein